MLNKLSKCLPYSSWLCVTLTSDARVTYNPCESVAVANWSRRDLRSVSQISPRPATSDFGLHNLYKTSKTLKTNVRRSHIGLAIDSRCLLFFRSSRGFVWNVTGARCLCPGSRGGVVKRSCSKMDTLVTAIPVSGCGALKFLAALLLIVGHAVSGIAEVPLSASPPLFPSYLA